GLSAGTWAGRRFVLQPYPDGSTGSPDAEAPAVALAGDGAQPSPPPGPTPDSLTSGTPWTAGQPEPRRPDGSRRLVVYLHTPREPQAALLQETLPASVRLRGLQATCSLREAFRAEFELSPAWQGELSLLLDSISSALSPQARILSAWLSLEPAGGTPLAPPIPPQR
ncbi:MAG TPA: hypothetical protein VHN99_03060, partial [Deinococcales bacterium]|nr:hypothetical protein [Deinococcales bacterium]